MKNYEIEGGNFFERILLRKKVSEIIRIISIVKLNVFTLKNSK